MLRASSKSRAVDGSMVQINYSLRKSRLPKMYCASVHVCTVSSYYVITCSISSFAFVSIVGGVARRGVLDGAIRVGITKSFSTHS